MIHIFSHYVQGRLIVLAALEVLVLLNAAFIGISLHIAGSGAAIPGAGAAVPPQAIAFALCMMVVISSMGLYQPDLWNNNKSIGVRLAAAFVLGFVATSLIAYLVPSLNPGPVALGGALMVALAGSVLVRAAFHNWNKLSVFKSRVLVLGTGSRAMKLAEHAQRSPNHRVVGFVALQPFKHYVPTQHVLSIAPGESLVSVVAKHAIDQIVVAVRDRRGGGFPVQQLLECKTRGVKVIELSTFFEREYRQVMLESLNPSWMVLGDGFRQGLLGDVVKRLFDLTVSGALLILTLPIMLIAALCIYLESGLPVFYRQERVGQGGRVFTIYKLRSMRNDAEGGGTPHWASLNDGRATRVGRFIRKWRIDELPQIINVFRGEMSFVGPRPERPFFADQLVKQIPYYALRHSAKPGITGWAQVRYHYGASVDDAIEKLQYDLYYVKNRCLFLDLMIMISTVEVVLWGRGAR
ncbi:MAG: TIGR03013 family XrtA/PEP-CTERM system glycosyltransferase [Gammaproteobacteria bacterium]